MHGRHYRRLVAASKAPEAAQAAVLGRILTANAATEFGVRHDFAQIRDIDDFRRAVPVQEYEDLRPHIERQEITGETSLTAERPVYYHRTSGTVGKPKFIPITETGLRRIARQQQIAAYAQLQGSSILDGKLFGIAGQAVEGRMPGGTPFGSASGLIYQRQSRIVRSRYVLPPEVLAIEGYEAQYLAMAVYGLSEPDVTCVATANPSTLVRLLSVVNQNADDILAAIAAGRLPSAVPQNPRVARALLPNPRRAHQLRETLAAAGRLTFADIWPNLKGVVTWTGGSCGVPLRHLSSSLPEDIMVIELGYLASEVRGTINVDVHRKVCLPTLLDTVFEFVERDAWERDATDFLSLHELEAQSEYYVFVTTPDGLYRYNMNDIVRVTGRFNNTPTLEFVQKGKGVTNITGEKLHESQVLDAVATLDEHHIQPVFFVALADQEASLYRLYVEAESAKPGTERDLADRVESRLRSLNIEYDSKRSSGRLARLQIRWLRPGAGDAYRKSRVAGGQRDAQFKCLHLQYAHECPFDFEAFALSG